MRDFRKLEIWTASMKLVNQVYKVSADFPSSEQFGLQSQIRRAAVSVPSNIAEGSSRKTNRDFARFLEIAIGSLFELETQLLISNDLNYINDKTTNELIETIEILQKQINSLLSKVRTG